MKLADAEEKRLDDISKQENILKLQGKTEKEILISKIEQVKLAIKARQEAIELTIQQNEATEAAAKRNRELVEGILNFTTGGINLLLKAIDLLVSPLRIELRLLIYMQVYFFSPRIKCRYQ